MLKITLAALVTIFMNLFSEKMSLADHWMNEAVDTSTAVAHYVSMKLSPNAPHGAHISYFDEANNQLKYARQSTTAGAWTLENIDNGGEFTSIALDSRGRPHISYYDRKTRTIKYATRVGKNGNCGEGRWSCTAVQSLSGIDEFQVRNHYMSIAVGPTNTPHISYYASKTIRYARKSNASGASGCTFTGWACLVIDESLGRHTSIVVDSNDNAFVIYNDPGDSLNPAGRLKYAHHLNSPVVKPTEEAGRVKHCGKRGKENPLWFFFCDIVTVNPISGTRLDGGDGSSVTLGPGNTLHISLYDPQGGTEFLMYSRGSGTKWETNDVRGVRPRAAPLRNSSIALDRKGTSAYISYQSQDGSLRYVKIGANLNSDGWEVGNTDTGPIDNSSGDTGRFSSIQVRPLERPVIAYFDDANRILKFARKTAPH
jgi:hypothetical protein